MDALLWIILGFAAATLTLAVVLLLLMVKSSKRVLNQLSRHELHQQRQLEEDRKLAAERYAELLGRIEKMQRELERTMQNHTEHSDRERAETLAKLRQELSDSIDRLENFLREPIL